MTSISESDGKRKFDAITKSTTTTPPPFKRQKKSIQPTLQPDKDKMYTQLALSDSVELFVQSTKLKKLKEEVEALRLKADELQRRGKIREIIKGIRETDEGYLLYSDGDLVQTANTMLDELKHHGIFIHTNLEYRWEMERRHGYEHWVHHNDLVFDEQVGLWKDKVPLDNYSIAYLDLDDECFEAADTVDDTDTGAREIRLCGVSVLLLSHSNILPLANNKHSSPAHDSE